MIVKLKPEGQIEVTLEEGGSGGRRRHPSPTRAECECGERNETGEESGAQVTSLLGSAPGFHPGDNGS